MDLYDYMKTRFVRISELKTEKNYYYGILLGSKMIITVSLLLGVYSSSIILTLNEDRNNNWLLNINQDLLIVFYLIMIPIIAGKEIINFHIKILNLWDKLFMKIINKMMYRHWKKNKQDVNTFDNISKYQFKLLGWWLNIPPPKRKALIYAVFIGYFAWQIIAIFKHSLVNETTNIIEMLIS